MTIDKMKSKLSTAAAVCATTAGALAMSVAMGTTASAAPVVDGSASPSVLSEVRSICADDLYVRQEPGGVIIGTLYRGENYDVDHYSPSRTWVWGHAYGNVHKDGWVLNGYFC